MESSANNNILNELLIVREELIDPNKDTIAKVLDKELKRNYTNVTVEWVTSHPDLSEPPFNLAAKGICGNTALLDFGHVSYFHLPFTKMKVYDFREILKFIGHHKSNSFIFGHGVYPSIARGQLFEVVLNASFPPATNKEIESKNKSGLTIIESYSLKCKKEMLSSLSKLKCAMQGTYFLSEGLKTDETGKTNESVLKVYAKGPRLDKKPFYGSKRFINSMQYALNKEFGSEPFVALGGVYTVNNVVWRHRSIRNNWENPTTRRGICNVNSPETMITTFSSSTEFYQKDKDVSVNLNSCQSYHSLSHHSSSEKHTMVNDENKDEEYVGYFSPVRTLFRIDEPPLKLIG